MLKKLFIGIWLVLAMCVMISNRGWASNPDEYFREGYIAFTSRAWDEAIALYTKSLKLNPAQPEVHFQRALTYEITERIDEAVKGYEKSLQLNPDNYLAMEYLAKLYELKGEYGKALDMYIQSLPLVSDPKWKGIIKSWISEANRKMRDSSSQSDLRPNSRRKDLSSGFRAR